MTKATEAIRAAVLGADRPFRLINGGPRPPGGDTPERSDKDPCPVTPLGDNEGTYYFLDSAGQLRHLTSRALGNKQEVLSLFRGDDTWLRLRFPESREFPDPEDPSGGKKISRVVGWYVTSAAAWLIQACSKQGLYGDHLRLRRPGIWRGDDGLPVVHCGDAVLMEGDWYPAGTRNGDQIWIAAPPTPRPDMPCDRTFGQSLHDEIQRLWKFRQPGGPALLIGLIATGLLGLAARWRPSIQLFGEGGSGKTKLMHVLRDACPMHSWTNNSTEAGVTGAMNGRVMPIFIDESTARSDSGGVDTLMDIVLASASGDGTAGVRGTVDGKSRKIEMAGCVLFGSVNPPSMLPQHKGRITLIELMKPEGGDDYTAEHDALAQWAKDNGPALWGRVIASAERWHASLLSIRTRLAEVGCAPREMDQMGALLAGWWILTREGLPGEAGAREAVGLASEYIRPADEIADDSGPRRAIAHLLSQLIQYDGTTRQEQVGTMVERAMEPSEETGDPGQDHRVLGRHGIRVVRPCLRVYEWFTPLPPRPEERFAPTETAGWVFKKDAAPLGPDEECRCGNCREYKGARTPRLSDKGGLWLLPVAMQSLFRGAHGLDGDRWQTEILRLGVRSKSVVRVGGVAGKAIWLPREAVEDG